MSWIEDPGWEEIRGLSINELKVDEAYVNITSHLNGKLWLYTLSDACYKVSLREHHVSTERQTVVVHSL